jgi:SAM-dependent methyltransferase
LSEQRTTPDPALVTSYDDFPYPALSYAQTHPDRLASMATLMGLEPPPVDGCRVLEIGCAVGGNLLPMAAVLPDSQFVGIDNAGKQIETGRQYMAELGLSNLRLEHMDVLDIPEALGKFDYIIAHGFYSWVPAEVRDELLAVIRRHMRPNGVAYVSYNTYPGWYLLRVLRDGMFLRARHLSDPAERAAAGLEIIEFMAKNLPEEGSGPFGLFLRSYRTTLAAKLAEGSGDGSSLLLHDEMAEINDPVYFEQFVAHANRFELQYLSEVDLSAVMPSRISPEMARELRDLTRDPMEAEQWLDFIHFRTFRQTLLVHQEAALNRRLRPQVVGRFKLASLARAEEEEVDLSPGVVVSFKASDEAMFSTDHPLTKAAFVEMIQRRPTATPFETLVRAAAARIDLTVDETATLEVAAFAANALQALSYSPGLIEFHVYQAPMSTTAGERPMTTEVMRWQARNGMKVTNLRHERVELDPLLQALIRLVDGRSDRGQMLASFMKMYRDGKFLLPEKLLETAAPEEIVAKQLEQALRFMARSALIVGEG